LNPNSKIANPCPPRASPVANPYCLWT
jgi:hypothetical protein